MNRIAVIIHILLVLISCKSDERSSDKKMFRYNCEDDITSLDPAFASNQDNIWAVSQLFNGLLELDSNLHPTPSIAKSWEVTNGGKIYTFHLRDDVYFHRSSCFDNGNGRKVNAKDFVYSFQRIQDPATASPGAWIFNDKIAENGFRALNDSTFQIELLKPFAPFTGILTMPYCMVIPSEAIDFYGKDFSSNPIGTGPFVFTTWEDDVAMLLIKNKNYFEENLKGNVDAIKISFIHNRQMALLLFLEGKLEMYSGLSGAVKDYLLTNEAKLQESLQKDVILEIMPFLNTEYLAIFSDDQEAVYPWNNRDFRKALSLSIDRKKMLRYLRNNVGHPTDGGFIPPGLPGHLTEVKSFDITLAKEFLERSGYKSNPSPIDLYTTKDYADLCIYIQKQFAGIGVECKLQVIPASHLNEQKRQGKLHFFRASWIMDYPDAENYLSCFTTSNFAPGGPNYSHFSSAEFDRLYERSLIQSNDSLRYVLYRAMDSLILEESPVIILFYDESIRLTRKWVSGLKNNALNIPVIKHVQVMN